MISNLNYQLTFGKYKDQMIRWTLLKDPSYILWLHENEILEFSEDIIIQAEENDDE